MVLVLPTLNPVFLLENMPTEAHGIPTPKSTRKQFRMNLLFASNKNSPKFCHCRHERLWQIFDKKCIR